MTRAVEHVGVPGYEFQAGVLWDGALVAGPLPPHNLSTGVFLKEIAPLGGRPLFLSIGFGDGMRFADRQGRGSQSIRRWLDGGRLPIPHVETADGDLDWHETVFAHLLGREMADGMKPRSNDVLVTHLLMDVRNTGTARRVGHVWFHFGDISSVVFGYKCAVAAELSPSLPHQFNPPFGMVDGKIRYVVKKPTSGELRWHDSIEPPAGMTNSAERMIEWEVPLKAGERASLELIVPLGLVDAGMGARLAALDGASLLGEVRQYWEGVVRGPGQLTSPEPFVNDYAAAVIGQMAEQVACRLRTTGAWMYKTSPNCYEHYWPLAAAKALPVFDLRGQGALSERVLQSFIDNRTDDVLGMDKGVFGRDEGLKGEGYARVKGFMGNFGGWTANPLVTSHGLALWALASHFRVTRDRAWLGSGPGSPLEAMLDGFDWISAQRKRTMHDVDGRRTAYWGLLPACSSHDWLAGNAIFNDGYCIEGMIEMVRLLREIGHPRAEEMAAELNAYRECLRQRYGEARDAARRLPLADGTTIPYVPRVIQELDWAKADWTYTGYGPLRAGCSGALDPGDPLVDQALAFLEAGLPRGEGAFMGLDYYHHFTPGTADDNFADVSDPKAERHYLWRHYVEYETMWPVGGKLFLERDDLPRYFEWLWNNLAAAVHRDFRVGVESLDGPPACAPGDAERWLALRGMFVNERGGYDGSAQQLFLLQAIPREWLRPGNAMSVRGMGTWFGGKVDLTLEVSKDGNSVAAAVQFGHLAVTPKEIRMRLRSGDGRPLRQALVEGAAVPVDGDDSFALPLKASGTIRVTGKFNN